jgi:hypothetical protein
MKKPDQYDLVLQDIETLKKEVLKFNKDLPKMSMSEQKKQIGVIQDTVKKIQDEMPLGLVVELGTDAATIAACAIDPVGVLTCFEAILALIDVIKVAKRSKQK